MKILGFAVIGILMMCGNSFAIGYEPSKEPIVDECKINGKVVKIDHTITVDGQTLICLHRSDVWVPELVNVKHLGK